jgi:hypothetical protein
VNCCVVSRVTSSSFVLRMISELLRVCLLAAVEDSDFGKTKQLLIKCHYFSDVNS